MKLSGDASCLETTRLPGELDDYSIGFNRAEALPPDEVSIAIGILGGRMIRLLELARQTYGFGSERQKRILDLGCGVGTILVGAVAVSADLPVEITGIDTSSSVLDTAEYNLVTAESVSESKHPSRQLSHYLFEQSWDDDEFWQTAGEFDVICFNPPYLKEGELIRESGYENVPREQLFSLDPAAAYRSVLPQALNHLAEGGSLIVRGSSRQPFSIAAADVAKEQPKLNWANHSYWTPVSASRQAYVDATTRLPEDWPVTRAAPHADPRLLILEKTGRDIGPV